MAHTLKGRIFRRFYTVLWTDEIAAVVLGTLGTLGGRFSLAQREIAIAWQSQSTGEDGWNRAQVFGTWKEALAYLRRDCLNVNFGAIYATPQRGVSEEEEGPRDWQRQHTFKHGAATPRGEIVLDIDLDHRSYDRSRVCECGERRQACSKCWAVFMVPAQRVMNALMERLGFQRWFAVFSGRRGLHYWLCDDQVIQMTAAQRKLFVETINTPPKMQSEWGREVAQILGQGSMEIFYPKIDVPVGADATHLHGVPLTLHPETQVFRWVVPRGELFDFDKGRLTVDDLTPDIMRGQRELLQKLLSVK